MSPDERALRADLAKGTFRVGVAEKRWQLLGDAWPYVFINVTAKDGRAFCLRFNCAGYPTEAPTAGLWDYTRNIFPMADQWPRNSGGRLSAVFRRDWKNGIALYLPCDREAFPGHENWKTEMPSKVWRPSVGITHYLELVHELLNSKDYLPVTSATA